MPHICPYKSGPVLKIYRFLVILGEFLHITRFATRGNLLRLHFARSHLNLSQRSCPGHALVGTYSGRTSKMTGLRSKLRKCVFFGPKMAILAPFCCVRLRAHISPTPPYITSKALNLPQHTHRPHTSTRTRPNCVNAPPEPKQGQKMTKKRKNRPSIGFSIFWACSAWI